MKVLIPVGRVATCAWIVIEASNWAGFLFIRGYNSFLYQEQLLLYYHCHYNISFYNVSLHNISFRHYEQCKEKIHEVGKKSLQVRMTPVVHWCVLTPPPQDIGQAFFASKCAKCFGKHILPGISSSLLYHYIISADIYFQFIPVSRIFMSANRFIFWWLLYLLLFWIYSW